MGSIPVGTTFHFGYEVITSKYMRFYIQEHFNMQFVLKSGHTISLPFFYASKTKFPVVLKASNSKIHNLGVDYGSWLPTAISQRWKGCP